MPQLPACVGTFEPEHITCNGDHDGKTEQDRMPCAWRNRCAGLQIFCEDRNEAPEFIVTSRSHEQLVRLCEKYVVERAIVGGIADEATSPDEETSPKKKRPRLGNRSLYRRRRRRKPPTYQSSEDGPSPMFLQSAKAFEAQLRDCLPGIRFVTQGAAVLVRPGTVYRVDRTKRAGYFAWYCTTVEGGRGRPLARVSFLPGLKKLNVELGLQPEALSKWLEPGVVETLNVRPHKQGPYFRAKAMHLIGDSLLLCAKSVATLLKAGAFELPGCFE